MLMSELQGSFALANYIDFLRGALILPGCSLPVEKISATLDAFEPSNSIDCCETLTEVS